MTVTDSDKSSVSVVTRFLLKATKRIFQQKVDASLSLRCQMNGGVKINGGVGDGERRFDISKQSLILVMNERREILNVKVSKQTRSEASKKKVLITRVSNI